MFSETLVRTGDTLYKVPEGIYNFYDAVYVFKHEVEDCRLIEFAVARKLYGTSQQRITIIWHVYLVGRLTALI
jgi:hypothetical protein